MAIATYLQDTMQHMAKGMKQPAPAPKSGADGGSAAAKEETSSLVTPEELMSFMQKARRGEVIGTAEILRFAPLFQDDITLDNVPRPQLVAICSILGLRPFGADAFLRFQVRSRCSACAAAAFVPVAAPTTQPPCLAPVTVLPPSLSSFRRPDCCAPALISCGTSCAPSAPTIRTSCGRDFTR